MKEVGLAMIRRVEVRKHARFVLAGRTCRSHVHEVVERWSERIAVVDETLSSFEKTEAWPTTFLPGERPLEHSIGHDRAHAVGYQIDLEGSRYSGIPRLKCSESLQKEG